MLKTVRDWVDTHASHQSIVVAYSGGRDSHVLLKAFHQVLLDRKDYQLSAVHVDHGLHPKSKDWADHCVKICQSYQIPIKIISLQLDLQQGQSVEAIARERRYIAFADLLLTNEILVVAHTQEDQAETFLLQLLRGSGPMGLASAPAWKKLGKGWIARPLLETTRADVTIFAAQNDLSWIEDPSNTQLRFRRNYLRHQILPVLQSTYPSAVNCIARSAKHCAQAQTILNEYLSHELNQCIGNDPYTLKLSAFKELAPLKQQFVLRHWLQHLMIRLPSTIRLETMLQQLLTAKKDAQPCVQWDTWQIRRHQDLLYLLPCTENISSLPVIWQLDLPLYLPVGHTWQARRKYGQGIATHKLQGALSIGYRQGGERCRPAGRKGSRPLKKLLQEYQIPSWQREHLPLFFHQQSLVAVGSLFVCEGWQVQDPKEEGWVLSHHRGSS